MNLIPDSELINIPVKDNGDELIDLRAYCPKIELVIIDPDLDERFYNIRKPIAEKLNTIQSKLKPSEKLVIYSAFRPVEIQKAHYEDMLIKVGKDNPQWSEDEIKQETAKRIAPPDIIPPHTAGAAIDLTISKEGKMLDMGTGYKEFNDKTETDSDKISDEQKKNRAYLRKLMTNEGFVNYPTEWWHYSYGDRYWSAFLNFSESIYDSVNIPR